MTSNNRYYSPCKINQNLQRYAKRMNGDNGDKELESLIETSERAGSLCTRTIGAGGGGFFVCWAPRHKHASIKEALPKIKTWVDVKFSNDGSQVIFAS